MRTTSNYSLLLPDEEDFYSVGDSNANMEIIDTQMKSNQTKADSVTTDCNNHISNKSNPHSVTKAQVGLSNVPNVTTNNQVPTYTVTSTLSALVSGEVLSTAFGKIAKAVSDLISHLSNKSNPHAVTKSQVGLGNVDNTSDANKPVSTAQKAALDLKVDKVTGKGLSTNDYTTDEKTKLSGIAAGAQVNSITGVKGNSESSYRTGNVNITPANIGLGSVNNTADSAKNVLSATKLTTARTISLGGQLTGSASFNGTSNVTLNASYTIESSVDSRSGYVKFSNGLLLQWGNISITPVPDEITSQPVTFQKEFAYVPVVIANGQTTGMGSTVKGVSSSDITVSGFNANIFRTNAYATTIIWIAIGFYK